MRESVHRRNYDDGFFATERVEHREPFLHGVGIAPASGNIGIAGSAVGNREKKNSRCVGFFIQNCMQVMRNALGKLSVGRDHKQSTPFLALERAGERAPRRRRNSTIALRF
jgi:hypothetical protein